MRGMEQEEAERGSFTRVAKELVSPNLLAHKDKGVKAWTACCLVDILRLCAPNAPYTGQQLKVGQDSPCAYYSFDGRLNAENGLGYIQRTHYEHPTGFSRSFECIQSAAPLRPRLVGFSEKCCSSHRHTILRAVDNESLHHFLRHLSKC